MTSTPPVLPQNRATVSVPIPEECIGCVVGKGGSNLRHLGASSGASVVLPREADNASGVRSLQLSGTPAQLQLGLSLLQDLLAQGQQAAMTAGSKRKVDALYHHDPPLQLAPPHLAPPHLAPPHAQAMFPPPPPALHHPAAAAAMSRLLPAAKPAAVRLVIDASMVGAVVGASGSGLKQLRELSGTGIDLGREPYRGGRLLCIRPPVAAALLCLQYLCCRLGGTAPGAPAAVGEPGAPPPAPSTGGSLTLQLLVPSHVAGKLVGKGGAGLKALRETHDVRVNLSREELGGERALYLTGGVQGVYAAACAAILHGHPETDARGGSGAT